MNKKYVNLDNMSRHIVIRLDEWILENAFPNRLRDD